MQLAALITIVFGLLLAHSAMGLIYDDDYYHFNQNRMPRQDGGGIILPPGGEGGDEDTTMKAPFFTCYSEGVFTDPMDSRKYWRCQRDSKNPKAYFATPYYCPMGSSFGNTTKACS